jgi:5-methylcytosine-specific restriction endonuclease McrA
MAIARSKGRHTNAEWRAMVEFFENRCVHCGSDEWFIERDHVIPVYQGGDDSIRNLQPSCAWCNASRRWDDTDKRPAFAVRLGKQMPAEWMAR